MDSDPRGVPRRPFTRPCAKQTRKRSYWFRLSRLLTLAVAERLHRLDIICAHSGRCVVTDDQKPILANTTMYLWIALTFAIGVALAEIPILFFNLIPAAFVFVGGWILICGYTFYRVWLLNTQSLVVNDVSLAKLIAGIFVVGLSGVLLYLGVMTSYSPASDNITWRIKGAFAGNALVALGAATLALFGTFVVEQIRAVSIWLKR